MLDKVKNIPAGTACVYRFKKLDNSCEYLAQYDGRKCTVNYRWEREKEGKDCSDERWAEIEALGGCYEVRFEDTAEYDILGCELEVLP